jgi:hypothetical protein
MSLRSFFTGFAKGMDKQHYNSVTKKAVIAELKYQTIDSSEKYFYCMDAASDYEDNLRQILNLNDPVEMCKVFSLISAKWINCSNEMKLLDPPPNLPAEAHKIFVDSHNLLIQSSIIRSQMYDLEIGIIEADLDSDVETLLERKDNLQKLKELDDEIHLSFRNAFDTVVHIIDNL